MKGLLLSMFTVVLTCAAQAQQLNADAGPDVTICSNGQATLNGSASGGAPPYTYSWSPSTGLSNAGVANPICTVNTNETYTLTVTDSDGNTNSETVVVSILPQPVADIFIDNPAVESVFNGLSTFSLCDPALSWTFDIEDNSSGAPGTSYSIDWGDGSPLYTPSAPLWSTSHTYAQGLWTLTYTITSAEGCVDSENFLVFLGTVPGAGIGSNPNPSVCTGGTLPFFLSNFSDNTPGTTYLIDFGDGQTVTFNHPPPAQVDHQFNVSSCPPNGTGSFTVNLTVTNPCDAAYSSFGPVRVSETPEADFTISPNDTVCWNQSVTFTDASQGLQAPQCTDPKNIWSISPGSYSISNGTLGSANGQPNNPTLWTTGSNALTVTFSQPGTYTITDVTGNFCGLDTLVRTICVEAPPVPNFSLSPLSGCSPLEVTTTNNSISNSCDLTRTWQATQVTGGCPPQPGSANINTPQPDTTTFTFTGAGTYQVILTL